MSWGMVAGAVVGGAVSYIGQNKANKQNAKAQKDAGYVDTTTTRLGDPRADPYREAGMDAAHDVLFGGGGFGGGASQTAAPPVAGTGRRPKAPAGMKYVNGALVPISGAAGGTTAPNTPAPRKFDGMSEETDQIRGRMMNELPKANEPLYGAGSGFVEDTLAGNSRNPLLDRATSAADDISEDPRLSAYQDFLMGNLGVGKGGQAVAGVGGGSGNEPAFRMVSGGGLNDLPGMAPGTGGGNIGATATGTNEALKKLVAGEAPAGWEEMQAAISRKVNEGRADQIRQLKAASVGSGFYGGSVYEDAMEGAIARGDQELADSLAGARFGAFQNALGLGTQYDLGMADMSSRERMNAANANASAGAASADIASREKLAQMGFLQDSLALGEQGRFGRAGALGDLAGLVSGDQGRALGAITDLTGGRRADLGAAGELSLGSDQARNAFLASRGSEKVGMANVGLGRAGLAFDRERFYDPLNRLGQYGDLLNTFYGGLGSETTQGRDTRAAGGAAAPSAWGAGLSGAALGAQVGSSFKRPPAAGTGSNYIDPSQPWMGSNG